MAMRSLAITLSALLLVLASGIAGIPEPDHIIYGVVPDADGTISVTVGEDLVPAASFAIGSQPALGDHYVLRIPMDSVGPRTPGVARVGDPAHFHLNGVPVLTESVGHPGAVQFVNLSDVTDAVGVRISDATLVEGDSGTTEALFELRLYPPSEEPVVLQYAVEPGTATPGVDYVVAGGQIPQHGSGRRSGASGSSNTFQFAEGTTTGTIAVLVIGDEEIEPDETFQVVLTQATGAPIVTEQAIGTIVDDDAMTPTVTIADAHVIEGNDAAVEVGLFPASDTQVSVSYTTAPGQAAIGEDFLSAAGTLIFEPGESSKPIHISIVDDSTAESIEEFTIRITAATNAEVGDDEASITILDDDSDAAGPVVGSATVAGGPVSVPFETLLEDPVVILGPPTGRNGGAVAAVIEQITGYSLDLRLQAVAGGTATEQEQVAYLAIEPGVHVMDDGSLWEAGVFEVDSSGSWAARSFAAPFQGTPELFLTVQDGAGEPVAAARAKDVSAAGFEAALFPWSSSTGEVEREIGYLAIGSPLGSGTVDAGGTFLPYLTQRLSLDEQETPVLAWTLELQRPGLSSSPRDRGARRRVRGPSAAGPEQVSTLALGRHLFAQAVEANQPGPLALRVADPEHPATLEWGTVAAVGDVWTTVPLVREFSSPVVVAKPVLTRDVEPVSMAVRNVLEDSFEVRALGWSSNQPIEVRVAYLVAEAGEHSLAGLSVEAGTLGTSVRLGEGWEAVPFAEEFAAVPVVLAGLQTDPGDAGMLVRIHNRSPGWFDLGLQDGPLDAGARSESVEVGWIAFEPGVAVTEQGRKIDVKTTLLGPNASSRPRRSEDRLRAAPVTLTIGDTGSTYDATASFVCFQGPGSGPAAFLLVEGDSTDGTGIVEDGCFFSVD
jgi:hypothetical protein